MTLPSYVATSNVNNGVGGSANTMGLNRPAAWTSGMCAIVVLWKGNSEAVTAPTSWTEVSGSPFRLGVTGDYAHVFTKILGGSEPASYTWSWTTSVYREGVGMAIQDTDQTTPINAISGQSNGSSTTITCPSITPTVDNTLLVCIGNYDNDTSYTSNDGMTERLDYGGRATTLATETGPACNVATGTNTFTASGSAFSSCGINIAFQEVGATCSGGGGGGLPFFMQAELLTGGMQELSGVRS